MRDFNTQAILLKKYKVSEADLSLVMLTEKFGKINLWMKGIRKNDQKYGAFVDFFSIMEIGIYKLKTKDKNILKSIKILEHNYNTRCDLEKFNIASFMLTAVNKMTETETGEEVFKLLKDSLISINSLVLPLSNREPEGVSSLRNIILKYHFFLQLLNILGYKFELDSCVGCNLELNNPVKRVFFSLKSGGIVCNICKKNDYSVHPQNYSDGFFLDYDLFLFIKKLSLESNFCNNIFDLPLDNLLLNKLNFFMNKTINHFLA
jgi:DNA repair protein RecO (recombination protein O)